MYVNHFDTHYMYCIIKYFLLILTILVFHIRDSQMGQETKNKQSSKTTTPKGRGWSCQGVHMKNLPKPPFQDEGSIPTNMCTHSLCMASFTWRTQPGGWLPRPLDRYFQLDAGLSGLTGCSIGRQRPQKESLPRPSYWDPRNLLPRPYKSRSSFPRGERLREFPDKWMGIIRPLHVGHSVEVPVAIQLEAPLVKPTWRTPAATYTDSQGASIRTIIEAGDWAHTSMMYGHYIRCLPREVLVRILEKTSASIQGVNVAKIATNSPNKADINTM